MINKRKLLKKNKELDFDYILLSTHGTYDGSYDIEINKQDDGILLEYEFVKSKWDVSLKNYEKEKRIIYSVKKDEFVYHDICQKLIKFNVNNWNGFNVTNNHILDGGGFNFTLKIADTIIVEASGNNSYPKNYREFYNYLYNLVTINKVEKELNSCFGISFIVPDKWINNLDIRYQDEFVSFTTIYDDQIYYLFTIYCVSYEFDNHNKYVLIGEIKDVKLNINKLYIKIDDSLKYHIDKLNDEQKMIINCLEYDCNNIIKSISVVDGYQLIKKYNC